MRKRIKINYIFLLIILFAAATIMFTACDDNSSNTQTSEIVDTTEYINVYFDTLGGQLVQSQKIAKGSKAIKPASNPYKEHSTFVGWYTDTTFSEEFEFDNTLIVNTTIYAKFTAHTEYTSEHFSTNCTSKGYTRYTCNDCGYYFDIQDTSVGEHSYSNWVVDEDATCTEDGTQHRTCTLCGDIQTVSIPATGHDYEFTTSVASTDTTVGYTRYTCQTCGHHIDIANAIESSGAEYIGTAANNATKSVARLYMYTKVNADPEEDLDYLAGLASGFLITDTDTTGTLQRYMVTNAHCVRYERATQSGFMRYYYQWASFASIYCVFEGDNTYYPLEVISYGAYSGDVLEAENDQPDLALLRIKGTQPSNELHPSLKIAESDFTQRGTAIALIGNPEGVGTVNSVSIGIVSQTAIEMPEWGAGYFIMTDAAINGGNSGGPMINACGTVVGIVESKLVSTDVENLGFVVSAGSLAEYLEKVKQDNPTLVINYTLSSEDDNQIYKGNFA